MTWGVKLNTDLLFQLPEKALEKTDLAARETIERAKEIAFALAAKRTTSMAQALYTVTSEGSGYAEATAAAEAVNPKVVILPEVGDVQKGQAVLADAAGHAEFIEYGTAGRAAQPFMTPAMMEAEGIFLDRLEERLKELT